MSVNSYRYETPVESAGYPAAILRVGHGSKEGVSGLQDIVITAFAYLESPEGDDIFPKPKVIQFIFSIPNARNLHHSIGEVLHYVDTGKFPKDTKKVPGGGSDEFKERA